MQLLNHLKISEKAEAAADRIQIPDSGGFLAGEFVEQVSRLEKDKHLMAYAGNIAFRSLFAVFPSLISLLWLLTVFHASPLAEALVATVSAVLPDPAGRALHQQLSALPTGHSGAVLTFGALGSLVLSLFAASASFRATMEALNVIQDVHEHRPIWVQYALSLGMAVVSTLLLVGALGFVLVGSSLGQKLAKATGFGIAFQITWLAATWLALLAIVLTAFSLIYYLGPDVHQRFRLTSRGTVVAAVSWLGFTWLFHLYINRLMNYTEMYGSLAGIAVLMIYVYANAIILVLGGAINRILEEPQTNSRQTRKN